MNLSRLMTTLLMGLALLTAMSPRSFSQVSITVQTAPPPLPEYDQPACPDDGYLWVPGYWAYGDDQYYWVPGTWVQPPEPDVYWTPGYWGWDGGAYQFNEGYWGPSVGYYGGIDYGYGYGGNGYGGGRWEGGHFAYNSYVNNLRSANIRNRYEDRSAVRQSSARVSFNGGRGGVQARPSAQDQQFASQRHIGATAAQQSIVQAAAQDPGQRAAKNGGRPKTAVVGRPEAFKSAATSPSAASHAAEADRVKAPSETMSQSPQGASSFQTPAEKHIAPAAQNEAAMQEHSDVKQTHEQADHVPVTSHVVAPSHTEAEVKPQTHSAGGGGPQPHAQAESKPAPHAQAESKAAPHPAEDVKR